jgi:hypothetical protein
MGNFRFQDGKQIRFWKDRWLGANTLKAQYLNLNLQHSEKKECVSS